MKTNILLAIDVAPGSSPLRHVSRAIEIAAQMVRDDADRIIVMHVREFSVARLARNIRNHGESPGRSAVDQVVTTLRAAGIRASGLIREADTGHVAQTILDAAAELDARLIVLGARGHTGLPRTPLDLATHLLHLSTQPVLIVPPALHAAAELVDPAPPVSADWLPRQRPSATRSRDIRAGRGLRRRQEAQPAITERS